MGQKVLSFSFRNSPNPHNSRLNMVISENIKQAKEMLLAEPGLRLALLYGSAVTGAMRADSDVDIALLFDEPLTSEKKMVLTSQLEKVFRRSIDLVDLFSLTGTILKQVLCKGVVLVKKDSTALAEQVHKMIYNQADMMPYVYRTLLERQKRFING